MCLDHQILILVISGGSCDTEDWSNDDKFSFDHRNKLYCTIYSHRTQMIYIRILFQIFCCIYCLFDQIYAALARLVNKFPIQNCTLKAEHCMNR